NGAALHCSTRDESAAHASLSANFNSNTTVPGYDTKKLATGWIHVRVCCLLPPHLQGPCFYVGSVTQRSDSRDCVHPN
ncbi:unnamed protein product, partial [Mycena citricolor]